MSGSIFRRKAPLLLALITLSAFLALQACKASTPAAPEKATGLSTTSAVAGPALPPEQVVRPEETATFMVFFPRDDTNLSPQAASTLDDLIAVLQNAPPGPVRVIGHSSSDEAGIASKVDPTTLSIKRAEAVRDYLVARNVPAHLVRVTGVGRGLPLVPDNSQEVGKNRRVEIILTSLSTTSVPGSSLARHPIIIENQVFTEVSGVPEYIVGPGDVLDITLWRGLSPERFEPTVKPDGRISFGFVEDAIVAGLTLSEIDNLLTDRLSEFIKGPRVDVLVKEFNSKTASIFGGVSKIGIFGQERTGPGTYTLRGKTTLLDLIIRAGGSADDAKLERVEIIRKDGRKVTVNLARAIFEADASQNIVLDDGDVVFVPLRADNRVFVVGEVNRQGTFIVDERITVLQAISMAGGFTIDANERKVYIFRGEGATTRVIVVDLKHIMDTGDRVNDTLLAHNDVIVVPTDILGKWNIWMDRIRPTLLNITEITGILLDLDAMTPGSGTGDRGPLFRD